MGISREQFAQFSSSPAAFRNSLLIESDSKLVRLGDVLEDWQRADFAATDPGWLRCVGRPVAGEVRSRSFIERPRGHSKSGDIALAASWSLVCTQKQICGYAAAADRDQSRLLVRAIGRLISANPWLADILEVQNYCIKNVASGHPGEGSTLEIMSCDVGSSFGLLPDFIVCDELTHWPAAAGEALWHSLISSAAKRSTCFVQIISNAGYTESWQWNVREAARTSPLWHFSSLDGPHAKWISEAILEEQRRLLPPAAYRRLWLNQWIRGGGDALELADIDAACVLGEPMLGNEPGFEFCAGLDLGIKNDHSALVVLGVHRESQRVRLASVQSWAPAGGGQIDLESVASTVLATHKRFKFKRVAYDPYQCALMAQQLSRVGVPMKEMAFVGANLNTMASTLLECFRSRRLDLYRDEKLMKDLTQLCIVEKSYGFKLEATRSAAGHADRAIALAIALPYAIELLSKKSIDLAAWLDAIDRYDSASPSAGPAFPNSFSEENCRRNAQRRAEAARQ